MTGKIAFEKQIEFQKEITNLVQIPTDSTQWYSYHMLAMQEEMGEVLKADKRWKTHRNTRYMPHEKLKELADIYITLMNITMFSEFSYEQLIEAANSKIEENTKKLHAPTIRG